MISSLVSLAVVTGLTAMSLGGYLLPLLIGWARRAPDLGAIAVIDILAGWTLVGWVVALAMALRAASPAPPPPGRGWPPAEGSWWAGPGGPPVPRPGSPPPLNLPPRPPAGHDDVSHS